MIEIHSVEELEKWYDEDYCLQQIKEDVSNLVYVKNQTEQICLEAVMQNPEAIRYVDIEQFPNVYDYYKLI